MSYDPMAFDELIENTSIKKFKNLRDGFRTEHDEDGVLFPAPIALWDKYPFLPLMSSSKPGNVQDFVIGDTENAYEQNKIEMGPDWKYYNTPIKYIINDNGYRAPAWNTIDWENSYVLLGCSCSFGVGLDEEETLSRHLSIGLKAPVINLGYPGGSNESIIFNLLRLLKHFPKPKGVIIQWTTLDRAIMWHRHQHYNLGPWDIANYPPARTKSFDGTDCTEQYLSMFLDQYNEVGKNYMWGQTAKELLKSKNIPSSYFSFFGNTATVMRCKWSAMDPDQKDVPVAELTRHEWARDLVHPGNLCMKRTAERIIKDELLVR